MISVIACVDGSNGIGKNGTIPWSLPPDMKRFKQLTNGCIVIMGRTTWESIGSKPLINRVNIVITSKPELISDVSAFSNLDIALAFAHNLSMHIFIIGGSRLYAEALPIADSVYLTRLKQSFNCDVYFPYQAMPSLHCNVGEWLQHKNIKYRFEISNENSRCTK